LFFFVVFTLAFVFAFVSAFTFDVTWVGWNYLSRPPTGWGWNEIVVLIKDFGRNSEIILVTMLRNGQSEQSLLES
jgi:hypothetical protein